MSNEYLVIGLGKSGLSVCAYLQNKGKCFDICAGELSESNAKAVANFGSISGEVFYEDALAQLANKDKKIYKIGVISPGISKTSKLYSDAKTVCKDLISELEFAYQISPNDWIAITGTNGKTTTTSLISHIFNESQVQAFSCGNIGVCATDAAANRDEGEYLVAECSSFQLTTIKDFCPSISILLNIKPDHITWHGDFENYVDDKCNIFKNANYNTVVIIDKNIPNFSEIYNKLQSKFCKILVLNSDTYENCAFYKNNTLFLTENNTTYEICKFSELQLVGYHNASNALAASAVCYFGGCSLEQIKSALMSFAPLEHRCEFAGQINSVNFYNDSKATNVDSTVQACSGFSNNSMILLLGGKDKFTDLDELVKVCTIKCKYIILYGESRDRFAREFLALKDKLVLSNNMKDATLKAFELSCAGDNVVLSPACASFDEFSGYEERGRSFKSIVSEIINTKAL